MLKTCIYCGDTFEAIRSSKKYCSDKCKLRYHALNDKIIQDGDSAEEMLKRLAMKAKEYPDKLPEVIQQVNRVQHIATRLSRILAS